MIGTVVALLCFVIALAIAVRVLSRRYEPYIREKTVEYLSKRFDSEVEIKSLQVSLPITWRAVLRKLRGVQAGVTATGIRLKKNSAPQYPPMILMEKLTFQVDLTSIWNSPARVTGVVLTGLQITIPPKQDRPDGEQKSAPSTQSGSDMPAVIVEEVLADDTKLTVLPKNPEKAPLDFAIHKLKLKTVGPRIPMAYEAELTNPKPPGKIESTGSFGPWVAQSPSDTPLSGKYVFRNANLGVFKGIAGILDSTGDFTGTLDNVVVDGETRTPDFRLTSSGNKIPLETRFHAVVDGRNGDTLLEPVEAKLGNSRFIVKGGVIRREAKSGKAINLHAVCNQGHIEDMLRLAMKGAKPIMRGPVSLDIKIDIPQGKGEFADRLRISGRFGLRDAHFTSPAIQDKLDSFSRRGQGQPMNTEIDEVKTDLKAAFRLQDGLIYFSELEFMVPGVEVGLTGAYEFKTEALDFRGALRLQAKVSQTMTGWKRWVLKPVDPFLSKEGAGTRLPIKVTGTREKPDFGLDLSRK